VKIYDSTITGCSSGLFGGGIYAQSASVELYNTIVTGNNDRDGQNDIYCFNGAVNLYNNSDSGAVVCNECSISKDHSPMCIPPSNAHRWSTPVAVVVALCLLSMLI